MPPPAKVLILGSSYVRRLGFFVHQPDWASDLLNLGFPPSQVSFRLEGISGGTIYPGVKSIQHRLPLIGSFAPDVVFLQIGGNDLDRVNACPSNIAQALMSFANMLITVYQVKRVLIGQVFYRFHDNGQFNLKTKALTAHLKLLLRHNENTQIFLWTHKGGFWNSPAHLYAGDKVHFNSAGLRKQATSVRTAIGHHLAHLNLITPSH